MVTSDQHFPELAKTQRLKDMEVPQTIPNPSFETGLDLDSVLSSFPQADINYGGVPARRRGCTGTRHNLWGKLHRMAPACTWPLV